MRVIAGTARSLPLKTPSGTDTRPTTDRIKETLFNMLQPYVPDGIFIDLFSGSGGIGIEALSRGAQSIVPLYFVYNKCSQHNPYFPVSSPGPLPRFFSFQGFLLSGRGGNNRPLSPNFPCKNTGRICVFTNTGQLHTIKVQDLPFGKFRDKGVPLDNVSNYTDSLFLSYVGISTVFTYPNRSIRHITSISSIFFSS